MLIAFALARIIADSAGPPPPPELADGDVLLIKRHGVRVGDGCAGGDAGMPDANPGDATAPDAGAPSDAGPDDAGVGDGGTPDAGCEIIPGDAITLMVQPRFSELTTGTRFALLMVTPARPVVEIQSQYLFGELAEVTAPQIIVHETKVQDPAYGKTCDPGYDDGGGCGVEPRDPGPMYTPPGTSDAGPGALDGGFTVDTIGPYEVVRAQPADTAELQTWLTGLGYLTLPADLAAVDPYITRGYTIVAIRVKVDATTDKQLSPIALTWPGSELRLPVALGMPAGGTAHETNVYIAAPNRYELPGSSIPFAWRTSFGDAGFLTKNIVVLDSDGDPDHDPVAEQAFDDEQHRETTDEYREVHVAVQDCGTGCDGGDDVGCGCRQCNAQRPVRGDLVFVVGVVAFVLRRKRGLRSAGASAHPRRD